MHVCRLRWDVSSRDRTALACADTAITARGYRLCHSTAQIRPASVTMRGVVTITRSAIPDLPPMRDMSRAACGTRLRPALTVVCDYSLSFDGRFLEADSPCWAGHCPRSVQPGPSGPGLSDRAARA